MITAKLRTLQIELWSVLFILLLGAVSTNALPEQKSLRILFIGNSYTYVNSLPQMFKAFTENELPDYSITVKFIGGGGATLERHWEVGEAAREIRSGNWNYVILQGQSMLGSNDLTDPDSPNQFYKYARKLHAEIKKSGAETIFLMTWARKNLPEQQKYLTNAYQKIVAELGSKLAPAGSVWENCRKISDIALYRKDRSHPAIAGTYLTALTLFGTIFNFVPEKLPNVLYGKEILRGGKLSDDKICLAELDKDTTDKLRQAYIIVCRQQ